MVLAKQPPNTTTVICEVTQINLHPNFNRKV